MEFCSKRIAHGCGSPAAAQRTVTACNTGNRPRKWVSLDVVGVSGRFDQQLHFRMTHCGFYLLGAHVYPSPGEPFPEVGVC